MNDHGVGENVLRQIGDIRDSALARIGNATSLPELETIRRDILGRSGSLSALRRSIGSLAVDERKMVGESLHKAQQQINDDLEARGHELQSMESALPRPLDV